MDESKPPTRGQILDFNEVDSVGKIRLETGQVVSFGHQSLRGIDPDHNRPVIVGLLALDESAPSGRGPGLRAARR